MRQLYSLLASNIFKKIRDRRRGCKGSGVMVVALAQRSGPAYVSMNVHLIIHYNL